MTERAAFMQAIIESPDDDTPRLVFADWLEEHGEAERAELIRLQCSLHSLSPESPESAPIQEQVNALLSSRRDEFLAPLIQLGLRFGEERVREDVKLAATASLCSGCQHQFNNKCVNCRGYASGGPAAKLCTSCSYNKGCAKCGGCVSSGAAARLCTSYGYQFSTKCFKCGGYES